MGLAKDYASLMVGLAQGDPICDDPSAIDEVIYLLMWRIRNILDAEDDPDEDVPASTLIGVELARLRTGFTSQGCHERFPAYDEAEANSEGGGPMWHIARTFQAYVPSIAATDIMTISIGLGALMYAIQKWITDSQGAEGDNA